MSDPVIVICPQCNGRGSVVKYPVGRRSRFTDADKASIRQRREAGERGVDLAREYGVTPSSISRILHNVGARA